jgi:lipoyl(octanoyl) transferase
MQNKVVEFSDLGLIPYKQAWDYQMQLFQGIIDLKLRNRDLPESEHQLTSNHLLFCEHPPVYTLGKTGMLENLLLNNEKLKEKNIEFFHINRGGDITFHGPGQLTGYPIFDLDNFDTDIIKFMRMMEDAIIQVIAEYGLKGGRIEGLTGVWLDADNPAKARKICAMGVHTSRWVTMHGFGLNIHTDMSYFNYIVPCGIEDKSVTSMEKELGPVNKEEVKLIVREKFAQVFGFNWK